MKKRKRAKWLCIYGPHGAGKSTFREYMQDLFNVLVLPRVTTRPPRPGEENSPEYWFIKSKAKFREMCRRRYFIPGTFQRVLVDGKVFHTAVPKRKYWPRIPKGTEFVLCFFGSAGTQIQKELPELKRVYITSTIENLRRRILERPGGLEIDPSPLFDKIYWHKQYESKIMVFQDFVVNNDGTIEKCAEKIVKWARKTQKP